MRTIDRAPYYVYILTNFKKTVLYVGVTNNLKLRIEQHYFQIGSAGSFTGRYHVYYLVYFESFLYINNAIKREKEIKGWVREKKINLILSKNPDFEFLNGKYFKQWPPKKFQGF